MGDRLDRIERTLEKVAKEQELFAEEMRNCKMHKRRLMKVRRLRDVQAETDSN